MVAQQRALLATSGSLGGAKPKAAIAIDGEEWVLKFYNGEPFDLPLVEHATMTLARKAGLQVAQTLPVRLQGEHAVAVKRFDRHHGGARALPGGLHAVALRAARRHGARIWLPATGARPAALG